MSLTEQMASFNCLQRSFSANEANPLTANTSLFVYAWGTIEWKMNEINLAKSSFDLIE